MFQNGRETDLPLSPDLNPSISSKEEFNNLLQEKTPVWLDTSWILSQSTRMICLPSNLIAVSWWNRNKLLKDIRKHTDVSLVVCGISVLDSGEWSISRLLVPFHDGDALIRIPAINSYFHYRPKSSAISK